MLLLPIFQPKSTSFNFPTILLEDTLLIGKDKTTSLMKMNIPFLTATQL